MGNTEARPIPVQEPSGFPVASAPQILPPSVTSQKEEFRGGEPGNPLTAVRRMQMNPYSALQRLRAVSMMEGGMSYRGAASHVGPHCSPLVNLLA